MKKNKFDWKNKECLIDVVSRSKNYSECLERLGYSGRSSGAAYC